MATEKKINYEMQGNEKPARNYLGKQKTVTVPVKWQSNPKAPKTQLAYITKAEKDLLIKKDLHGSLKKGANTGPSGIMSLDSQGDYTADRSPGSNTATANDSNQDRGTRERAVRAEAQLRDVLTGNQNIGQTSAVSNRTRRGAMPEVAYGPDGRAKMMYAQKAAGNPQGFLGRLFSGNNQYGYRDTYNKTGGFMGFGGQNDVRFNPVTQRYEFEEEETGDVKPGRGGQILGGLAGLLMGIPFVGSAIGNSIDRFKPKSYMQKQTPEELSRMRGLQMIDGQLVDTRMLDFNPNAKINQDTSGIDNSLALNSFNKQPDNTNKGIPYTNKFTTSGNSYPVNQVFTDDMTTYTNAMEQGNEIGDDEQMYIDNQIAAKRFP
tara:strand:- start:42 stop:1169 length:1128 start_codon:yes stop_codon:yes gene_type:complete